MEALYLIVGKIVEGVGKIAFLALLGSIIMSLLFMAYDILTQRWRIYLLGSSSKHFLIEEIFEHVSKSIEEAFADISLKELTVKMQNRVIAVLQLAIFTPLISLSFFELGIRYALKRLHKPATTIAPQ